MAAATQISSAIELAFNPTTSQDLKAQAYEFLNALRADPNAWMVCLEIFTSDTDHTSSTPPPSEVVRIVCLEIVNNAVQSGTVLDMSGLEFVREKLMSYVQRRYGNSAVNGDGRGAGVDSPGIQNKVTQTLTYLFVALYKERWTGFFEEFKSIAGINDGGASLNEMGTMLFLRIIGSIHDEIADVMIPRSWEEQRVSMELKDLIRARDVGTVALTWQEVLSRWRELDLAIVELCLRTIAKWVSWVDVSLVVDAKIQSALLELAGSNHVKVRDAAIDTFTETVGKKMGSADKVELISYLNLEGIVGQLIASPALAEFRTTPHYDTDLAETVAKLVNNIVFDLVKVLDSDRLEEWVRAKANALLSAFVPFLLRFFGDEYDEICSAVIPSLTELLTMFRRMAKGKGGGGLAGEYEGMLRPILDAVVGKMKYDETTSWGDEEEGTDEAEFQELRKRLYVLQQTVAAVDERLYINVLSDLIGTTFSRLDSAGDKPNWRDLDLALHEMYLFGELAVRNGGLYQKSAPSSEASQRLLEMMSKMVESGLANHPHPAIQLQYMEICVRYVQFFEHNPASIPKVLETFVAFVHSTHPKVRLRSWYLFQRFVRHLRRLLGNVAETVVRAIGDLLVVKAEVATDGDDDDDASSEDNARSADAAFQSQLYLFDAVGSVASTNAVPVETKVNIAKSIVDTLVVDMHQNLQSARNGDARALMQIHHLIMALGTLAYGFSDWMPSANSGTPPPTQVSAEFLQASEAVITSLEDLNTNVDIRTASRHAFSRFLGVLGSSILPQLPRWIDGLLSSTSTNDEMAMFLRTLSQVVYGFKSEIQPILDTLLTPLLRRVFDGLATQTTGTDDEIQLQELKTQFLAFILVILNNDLSTVLVSPANQSVFEHFISTLTRLAIDPSHAPIARQAFSTLTRISGIWGGPDIPSNSDAAPTPMLAGFDGFMLSTFAPLPWSLLSAPGFQPGDAQMRSVVQEAAALQWTLWRKVGGRYRGQLQEELRSLGAGEEGVRGFVTAIDGDVVGFRKFFVGFVGKGKG